MANCLILGGNGFIGSHLAESLLHDGHNVTIFNSIKRVTSDQNRSSKVKFIKGDFLKEKELNEALGDIDYVFHYISTTNPATSLRNPVYDIDSNVIGSVRLFQMCVKNNIKKIIFPSSGGTIYGEPINLPVKETDSQDPVNPYAIGKLMIEKYLYYFNYVYSIDYCVLRYSNPYGEGQNPTGLQGVIPIFLNKIKNGESPIVYGDGSMIRDYIYIDDAIEATLKAIDKKTNYRTFNIGSGKGTSINELLDIISDVVGSTINPIHEGSGENYISKIILDISRAKSEIHWEPKTDLHEGISRTWDWIKTL